LEKAWNAKNNAGYALSLPKEGDDMNAIHSVQTVTGPTITIPLPAEFEGKQVEIDIRVVTRKEPWGEGLKRCAGALADDSEWDAIMDEIHLSRKLERRPLQGVNDASSRHGHLLRAYAPSRWFGPSIHAVFWRHRDFQHIVG
jgi:hypothetical protein